MKLTYLIFTLLTAATLLGSPVAKGQEGSNEPISANAPVVDKGPEDALDRGNPRSSITGFLRAASAFNWDKAAEYLDLRDLPPDVAAAGGPELAREFNHVLARSVWFDDYTVSSEPAGLKGDGLPADRDELVTLKTESGDVQLWMQQVLRGDGAKIWKLSNRSVALIPKLYDQFSYPPAVEKIRTWFPESASFLGLELFKWFIIIVTALLCWPVYRLIGLLITRIVSSPDRETFPLVRKIFSGPLAFLAILLTMNVTIKELGAGAQAQQILGARTLTIAAVVWTLWAIVNLFRNYQQEKLIQKDRPGAAKLMQPMTTLLKILVLIFGFLFWLHNLGVNITTVLAGLGVGGLAVALALQKPIEDMMGALSIFTQAPIRVGDFCRYGTEMGVVEDIGLRTTRLRTLTNSIVSIPNSRIASLEVENLSYRTKIRYAPTLRLRYDTSQNQLTGILHKVKDLLVQDEQVYDDPLRVNFTDFADDAILVRVHSFIKTTDITVFLAIAERLNLAIMSIVREEGATFALPGLSVHLEGTPDPA